MSEDVNVEEIEGFWQEALDILRDQVTILEELCDDINNGQLIFGNLQERLEEEFSELKVLWNTNKQIEEENKALKEEYGESVELEKLKENLDRLNNEQLLIAQNISVERDKEHMLDSTHEKLKEQLDDSQKLEEQSKKVYDQEAERLQDFIEEIEEAGAVNQVLEGEVSELRRQLEEDNERSEAARSGFTYTVYTSLRELASEWRREFSDHDQYLEVLISYQKGVYGKAVYEKLDIIQYLSELIHLSECFRLVALECKMGEVSGNVETHLQQNTTRDGFRGLVARTLQHYAYHCINLVTSNSVTASRDIGQMVQLFRDVTYQPIDLVNICLLMAKYQINSHNNANSTLKGIRYMLINPHIKLAELEEMISKQKELLGAEDNCLDVKPIAVYCRKAIDTMKSHAQGPEDIKLVLEQTQEVGDEITILRQEIGQVLVGRSAKAEKQKYFTEIKTQLQHEISQVRKAVGDIEQLEEYTAFIVGEEEMQEGLEEIEAEREARLDEEWEEASEWLESEEDLGCCPDHSTLDIFMAKLQLTGFYYVLLAV